VELPEELPEELLAPEGVPPPLLLVGLELTPVDLLPVLLGVLLTAGEVLRPGELTFGVERWGACCLAGGE
jgi:hypothetical protein